MAAIDRDNSEVGVIRAKTPQRAEIIRSYRKLANFVAELHEFNANPEQAVLRYKEYGKKVSDPVQAPGQKITLPWTAEVCLNFDVKGVGEARKSLTHHLALSYEQLRSLGKEELAKWVLERNTKKVAQPPEIQTLVHVPREPIRRYHSLEDPTKRSFNSQIGYIKRQIGILEKTGMRAENSLFLRMFTKVRSSREADLNRR